MPKRCVFRDCVKESKESPGRRSPGGRLFHSRGLLFLPIQRICGPEAILRSIDALHNNNNKAQPVQLISQTSIVDVPAITVAHRVGLLDNADNAALGQRQVQLLRRSDVLSHNILL